MKRAPRGFTLVELLVVIGVIALLIGILLPTLQRVRAQSLVTTCAANLRSMGQCLQVYATDSKGRYPLRCRHVGGADDAPFFRTIYWREGNYDLRADLGCDRTPPYTTNPWPLASRLWNARVWMCPGPTPENYPYRTIDQTRSQGSSFHHHTNYIMLWNENAQMESYNAWNAAPGRSWPTYYKGPQRTSDSASLTLAQDAMWVSTDATDIPGPGFARANHIAGGGGSISGKTGSSRDSVETGVLPDTEINSGVIAVNVLYNDAHVSKKLPGELSPILFVIPPAKIAYIDVPQDMGR